MVGRSIPRSLGTACFAPAFLVAVSGAMRTEASFDCAQDATGFDQERSAACSNADGDRQPTMAGAS
jgi:hypothetical protein